MATVTLPKGAARLGFSSMSRACAMAIYAESSTQKNGSPLKEYQSNEVCL